MICLFSFIQDTILTLEALSRYSLLAKQAVLNMMVNVEYRTKGDITTINLTQQKPVAKPIDVRLPFFTFYDKERLVSQFNTKLGFLLNKGDRKR